MKIRLSLTTAILSMLIGSNAQADDRANAEDARAMLNRAVIIINVDEKKALEEFTEGSDTFLDRDLYVFCASEDHKVTANYANPDLIGKPTKDIKDAKGKPFLEQLLLIAEPGKVNQVEYMSPQDGKKSPVTKIAFTTKVKDQVCAVSYYKDDNK